MQRVLDAVLAAADPRAKVAKALRSLPVSAGSPVIAIGKAAVTMTRGMLDAMPEHRAPGVIVSPAGDVAVDLPGRFVQLHGEHPVPGAGSLAAGKAVAVFARELSAVGAVDEPVVVLLSGGASALVTAPVSGLTIEDVAECTRACLTAGASIQQLNALRRRIDAIKGGGLARWLSPRKVRVLVLSDVLGDALHDIGSGPCADDPLAAGVAVEVLRELGLEGRLPRIAAFLAESMARDAGSVRAKGSGEFETGRVTHEVIASNRDAVSAATATVMSLGFMPRSRGAFGGSAESLAMALVQSAQLLDASQRPAAVIIGGETTVRVPAEQPGHEPVYGGRNQHAAMAACDGVSRLGPAALMCLGTDGVDGVVPEGEAAAAGALVTHETAQRARGCGLEPGAFLRRADSYGFFRAMDARGGPACRIVTGPTGTNVNDVAVLLCYGE